MPGSETDTSAYEKQLAIVLDLKDLGVLRSEGLAYEAPGFCQDFVQVLTAERELAKLREHPLPPDHLLGVSHVGWRLLAWA
ncbi:hypothetical protein JMJ56_28215 [Belnapia sp. T18]|uniref:Uncharacterized protein n=1 Tax=Belnapia arida TaxID=2804533 RepID=A0ABS1UB13_9PROT|nr:hypothetical protein [Belnapia arida]MBL6081875.1 hypothetical protein [Belnapia arida]